jgi:hypothetical protein
MNVFLKGSQRSIPLTSAKTKAITIHIFFKNLIALLHKVISLLGETSVIFLFDFGILALVLLLGIEGFYLKSRNHFIAALTNNHLA